MLSFQRSSGGLVGYDVIKSNEHINEGEENEDEQHV
jgi:hypothetical protein